MRQFAALATLAMLALVPPTQPITREEIQIPVVAEHNKPKRRKNKTANKINVFMSYASDRKGKGQKKRDASRRQKNGWR